MERRGQIGAAGLAMAAMMLLVFPHGVATGAWPNPNGKVKKTESGHPEVLFTFDDGPDHKNTGKVLDTLAEYNVQAIFYTVGYRVANKGKHRGKRLKMLERIVSERHLIGNHTVTHAHLCAVSAAKAASEIDNNRKIYEKLIGLPVFLFRAPYGDKCKRLKAMLKERGIVHDHWDVDPREWQHASTEITTRYVTRKLRNLKGRAVILMHDTKSTTTRALPKILKWIDKENVKRRKAGEKTIRIIGGSEWVAQNWDVSLWSVATGLTASIADRAYLSADLLLPGARLTKSAQATP